LCRSMRVLTMCLHELERSRVVWFFILKVSRIENNDVYSNVIALSSILYVKCVLYMQFK